MRERIRQTYTSLEIGLMQEENEQLKRRLEKAIEFINNFDIYTPSGIGKISSTGYGWRLLAILQGEENV